MRCAKPPPKKAFVDNTHHNSYGSYELAKCIVEGIRAANLGIVKFLVTDIPKFDPAHPDPIDNLRVPASLTAIDATLVLAYEQIPQCSQVSRAYRPWASIPIRVA